MIFEMFILVPDPEFMKYDITNNDADKAKDPEHRESIKPEHPFSPPLFNYRQSGAGCQETALFPSFTISFPGKFRRHSMG